MFVQFVVQFLAKVIAQLHIMVEQAHHNVNNSSSVTHYTLYGYKSW